MDNLAFAGGDSGAAINKHIQEICPAEMTTAIDYTAPSTNKRRDEDLKASMYAITAGICLTMQNAFSGKTDTQTQVVLEEVILTAAWRRLLAGFFLVPLSCYYKVEFPWRPSHAKDRRYIVGEVLTFLLGVILIKIGSRYMGDRISLSVANLHFVLVAIVSSIVHPEKLQVTEIGMILGAAISAVFVALPEEIFGPTTFQPDLQPFSSMPRETLIKGYLFSFAACLVFTCSKLLIRETRSTAVEVLSTGQYVVVLLIILALSVNKGDPVNSLSCSHKYYMIAAGILSLAARGLQLFAYHHGRAGLVATQFAIASIACSVVTDFVAHDIRCQFIYNILSPFSTQYWHTWNGHPCGTYATSRSAGVVRGLLAHHNLNISHCLPET